MSSQPENPQYDADDRYAPGDEYAPGADRDMDEPSGPPYRAIAMVLLAAVVLAIGVGLVQLFGGDDDSVPAADETTSQTEQAPQQDESGAPVEDGQVSQPAQGDPAAAPEGQPAPAEPAPGDQPATEPAPGQAPANVPPVTSVPVQVFNNSNVTGLAGRTGEALRESGFAVADVSNLPSDQGVVSESTAYYGGGPGEQQAAQAIAAQLGIPAKPRPAQLAVETPGVIVIVTQDLDR